MVKPLEKKYFHLPKKNILNFYTHLKNINFETSSIIARQLTSWNDILVELIFKTKVDRIGKEEEGM